MLTAETYIARILSKKIARLRKTLRKNEGKGLW